MLGSPSVQQPWQVGCTEVLNRHTLRESNPSKRGGLTKLVTSPKLAMSAAVCILSPPLSAHCTQTLLMQLCGECWFGPACLQRPACSGLLAVVSLQQLATCLQCRCCTISMALHGHRYIHVVVSAGGWVLTRICLAIARRNAGAACGQQCWDALCHAL